jgi:hypothetical protein
MGVQRRIGEAISAALGTGTDIWKAKQEWDLQRSESEALERYRNAQAAELERRAKFQDLLYEKQQGRQVVGGQTPQNLFDPIDKLDIGQLGTESPLAPDTHRIVPKNLGLFGVSPEAQLQHLPSAGRDSPVVTSPDSPMVPSPDSEDNRYGFVVSGSPEAQRFSGSGADVVAGLPSGTFGGTGAQGRPVFEASKTGSEWSPQYDEGLDELRQLAEFSGYNALNLFPRDELPAFTNQQAFIQEHIKGLARATVAAPTCFDYTNSAGQSVNTCANLDILLNAPKFHAARSIEGMGSVIDNLNLSPMASLDATARNNVQIQENRTVDQITQDAANSPLNNHNPLQRAMNDNPLGGGGVMDGPFGPSITTVNIDPVDRRVLQNLIPLSNVIQQIGDLSMSLNQQESRFMAGAYQTGQFIDTWFNTTWWTPADHRPMNEGEIEDLWDEMNPNTTDQQRDIGINKIRQLSKLRHAYAGLFAEMGGERGRKSDDDVRRALQMVPGAGETRELTLSMLDNLYKNFINTYNGIVHGPIAVLEGGGGITREDTLTESMMADRPLLQSTAQSTGIMGEMTRGLMDIGRAMGQKPEDYFNPRDRNQNQENGDGGTTGSIGEVREQIRNEDTPVDRRLQVGDRVEVPFSDWIRGGRSRGGSSVGR